MYVSSYSTYIATNPSQKIEPKREEKEREGSVFKLPEQFSTQKSYTNLPIDYISKNSGFWQKYELQQELKERQNKQTEQNTQTFIDVKKMQSAKEAYSQTFKSFSFYPKPHAKVIDQTPKIDTNLPTELQQLKELKMRNLMVNTYIANDRYYKITA